MKRSVELNYGFEFIGSDGTQLVYKGHSGNGLHYFDEFEYDEDTDDFTISCGQRLLTRFEVERELKSADGRPHTAIFID